MSYSLDVGLKLDRKFYKMAKRERKRLEILNKKVSEILKDPFRFKPLKGDLHGARRVHIDSSFVLVYEVDEKRQVVRLLDFDHHDKIY